MVLFHGRIARTGCNMKEKIEREGGKEGSGCTLNTNPGMNSSGEKEQMSIFLQSGLL